MMTKIAKNVPLKRLTTLNVGGEARYFIEATSEEDILEGLGFAKKRNLKILVLSGGSNVLISDNGFDGLVIANCIKGSPKFESFDNSKTGVTVTSGVVWDHFVEQMVKMNYAGIECLSGIPGKVGAAPIQNIGAYGQEVGQTIKHVRAIDITSGRFVNLQAKDCLFGYRSSIFNSSEKGRYIITAVTILLQENGTPNSSYPDVEKNIGKGSHTLSKVRDTIIAIRHAKGMVRGDVMSVGSFFKNPTVSMSEFEDIFFRARQAELDVSGKWYWNLEGGNVKISAARIIQESGFPKGYPMRDAGVSPFHSLALVNSTGKATASDIVSLAVKIQERIFDLLGIKLIPEPEIVGFGGYPLKF